MVLFLAFLKRNICPNYEIENDFQSFSLMLNFEMNNKLFSSFIECDTSSGSMLNVYTLVVGSFQVFNGHEYYSKTVLIARLVSSTA